MSGPLALNTVHVGDIREVAPQIAPGSVNCVVTSPPYFQLRRYLDATNPAAGLELGGEPTVAEYVANLVGVFRLLRPALRPDATVFVNLGDSYANDAKWGGATGGKHAAGLHGENGPGRARTASGLPPKCLVMAPARFALAMIDDGWILRNDIIWCLSGGTRVYAKTQKGIMPMTIKDLVRLNPATVQLWNGEQWTQVRGWSETPRPEQPLEITLRSGERIGCTPNHQWPTRRGIVRTDDLRVGDIIQATRLPDTDNLGAPALPRSVAWVAGFFLAEGHREHDKAHFSMHAKERDYAADLRRFALFYGGGYNERVGGNKLAVTITGRVALAVLETYIAGEGSKRKHLTVAAWQRNNDFLGDLLDGYLAGDGHWDESRRRWMLGFTQNDALAADLRTLCARLGYSLRLRRCVHQNGVARHPGWRGQIRKVRSDSHTNREDGEVIAVGYSRARKFWDIGVAEEPHLFALASGVLTHNSKPNPMPESVTDRFTSSYDHVFLFAKRPTYWADMEAVREPQSVSTLLRFREGQAPRTRGQKFRPTGEVREYDAGDGIPANGRNARDVWTIPTAGFPGGHHATFPPELARRCVRAGCPPRVCARCGAPWVRVVERAPVEPFARGDLARGKSAHWKRASHTGAADNAAWRAPTTLGWRAACACDAGTRPGVVLDPFMGSGTTALVAVEENRDWLGVDLDPRSVGWTAARLAGAQRRLPLDLATEAAGG